MRIGLFSDTYLPAPDGVSTFLSRFTRELESMGHEPHLFTPRPRDSAAGDKLHEFLAARFPLYPEYWIAVPQFTRVLYDVAKLGLDVAHIHTPFFMGTAGVLSARSLGLPLLATFHTNFLDMSPSVSNSTLFRGLVDFAWRYSIVLYNRCRAVTISSDRVAERLRRDGVKRRICVIPLGVDVESLRKSAHSVDIRERLSIPSGAPVVTYLGRLTWDKGIHTLIDAVALLNRRVYLVVAGVGPELPSLREHASKAGLEEAVRFPGFVEEGEKASLLAQSDAVVLASRADLRPIVLMEAMTLGTPVIGSRAGGIPDLIEHGRTGLLVELDNAEDLSKRISEVLEGNTPKDVTLNALREVEENYSTQAATRRFLDLYRQLSETPAG